MSGEELENAAAVSPRWVQWRRRTDLAEYDARFERMAAAGLDVHGEADLISSYAPTNVLDAGCGTGRIAIELARRSIEGAIIEVTGVDLDADMIDVARRKSSSQDLANLDFSVDDLARMRLGRWFDLIAMPGNVMIFCASGDRARIVRNLAGHLRPGGRLIAGFSLEPEGYSLDQWDQDCTAAGLTLEARFGTWARAEFSRGDDYHVSVHLRPE